MSSSEAGDIDESKLSGDDGDIYLLQWLAEAESDLRSGSPSSWKTSQAIYETKLLKVIYGTPPYPNPGRPFRQIASRCLVLLYSKGEARTLFDTLRSLLKLVGDMKTPDMDFKKVAAFYCIGELMHALGSQIMSLMAETALCCLKNFRASSSSVLLRYHTLSALRKAFTTAGRAIPESTLKDILKHTRNALSDKALPIQRAAADLLVVLYPSNDGTRPVSDVELIITACVKSLDQADQLTRRSLARLAGHILASTQTARVLPPPDTFKRSNKKDSQKGEEDEIDAVSPSALAAESAAKPILTPTDMFSQLSTHFNKATSRKVRIGIFDFYAALISELGTSFVEANYDVLIKHLFSEIITAQRPPGARDDSALTHSLVGIILRDLVGVRLLSEQGQISAIQELSKSYLKKWPALMPGQVAPNASVLVIALKEVAGLVQQLGNAPPPVQDALAEPLVTLLGHPSHTARVAAAWALRNFCFATPLRIPKIVLNVLELLQRDMSTLANPAAPSDISARAIGHAYGLGALFAVIPERPLYVSADLSAKVFDTATQLLRRAGEHDMDVATIEVEAAWTAIAALMALGPAFVRAHLPQLLVLWRNALPKPTSKDTAPVSGRNSVEWDFLLHVRACALGAVRAFLRHNARALGTRDVVRRLAGLLGNALALANAYVSAQGLLGATTGQSSNALGVPDAASALASAREALLRRRVYQCFTELGCSGLPEATQTALLQSTSSLFSSPEGYQGSALQAAIASAGNFTSLWNTTDGYAYGVTTIQVRDDGAAALGAGDLPGQRDRLNRDSIEARIDDLITQPVLGSCEHDPLLLCQGHSASIETEWPEPPPPATAVVDAAIELFAALLPLQDAPSCGRVTSEVIESTRSPRLEKNAGRKAAVDVNATIAITLALRNATASNARACRDTLGSTQIANGLSSFLKDALINGDPVLRLAASEALGRLASLSGTNFLTSQVKTLVDLVVNNRDPYARAGCALAFGAIYTHVGGLAAGPLLKTTVNVLMSLGNDPHPVVHFWALSALAQVINAASLAYAPFVPSTLGMLFKLYLPESHDPDGGTVSNANLKGSYPVYQVICQLVDAVVAVLGPDIQESVRTRRLILNLVQELASEPDGGVCVEAIKCIQHLLMFAPDDVDIAALVNDLRAHLSSERRPLKFAAINALYQLVQRDALAMSKLGGDKLVEELFGMLDRDASIDGVRNVITSWLEQTVVYNPSAWIDLCQRIMSRTTASQRASDPSSKNAASGLADDEGQSLSVGMSQDSTDSSKGNLTSRWRTQLFALRCLHSICTIVARSGRREHLDIPFARSQRIPLPSLLVSRVPDLIKMAFTASAAYVTEIRLEGLVLLRDVIEVFAKSPDSDYEGSLLLEQYQAPVTAALTPAFSSDSTPEILALAVQVCAAFVGSGIVKDVSRMGRILKLLTSALEQSKESGMLSLGEAGELSPNASVMLRISTLSAWAELQVASVQQRYLKDVVQPYRQVLGTFWIAALRDYASIKGDSEVFQDSGSATIDAPYASLGREVLLPYYDKSWSVILHAVATTMKLGDPQIIAAMDGQESIDSSKSASVIQNASTREEPTSLFFAIFGLIYEALAVSSADSTPSPELRQNAIVALEALKSLVRLEYSGKALLDPTIFDEFTSLSYRMAMTESATVQTHLVEVLAILAASQKDNIHGNRSIDQRDGFSLRNNPLTHCFRICAYILRNSISGPETIRIFASDSAIDRISLIRTAFSAFMSIAEVFGPASREEMRTVAIAIYAELLKEEKSDLDMAGPTLQSLKALLESPPSKLQADALSRYSRLVHGLFSACLVNIDEMRGRQGAISTMKVTNNLLAAVLILTVVPPYVGFSEAALEYCCSLLSQKLLEKEVSITAAHCIKTIVTAGASGNILLKHCTRLLLPGMVEYTAFVAALSDDQPAQDAQLKGLEEILRAISAFFASTPDDFRTRALGVILPTLTLLLDPSKSTPSAVHSIAVSQILSLATQSPAAFKEATGRMDPAAKDTLETSVRQAIGSKAPSAGQTGAKPQISLKSF